MDILVRNSQVASIYQAFVATGEWLGVDESSMPTFAMGGDLPEHRSVQRLRRYDDRWYILLCTEDSYRISVDTKKIQVPHVLAFNSVLVESEFHHNTDRRPFLLTDEQIKFINDPPITFPVFIPTIPEYLDSCLDIIRDTSMDYIEHKLPRMDMSYLARYLCFHLPHVQDKLLAKVKNRKQLAEYFAEGEQRQVRRMERIMERRAKYAGGSGPLMEIPPQFRNWTR